MIQRLKKLLTGAAIAAALLVPVAVPSLAMAATCATDTPDIQGCLDTGACLSTDTATCVDDPGSSVNSIITTIINILSLVVGVVAVIMIIIGGIRFVMSGGDSANVTSARNTILYAIVGLVIVALAQVIVRFVLDRAAPTG